MEIVKVCNLFNYELYDVELSSINDGDQDSDDFKRKLVKQINAEDISDDYLNSCRFFKIWMKNCNNNLEIAEYLEKYKRANVNGIKETKQLQLLEQNDVIVFVDCYRLGKSFLNRYVFEGNITPEFINQKKEAMDIFVIFIYHLSKYDFEGGNPVPEMSHFLNLCIVDKFIKKQIDRCVDNYGDNEINESSMEMMDGYREECKSVFPTMDIDDQPYFLLQYSQTFTAAVCKKLKIESEKFVFPIEPDVINPRDIVRFTVNDETFVLDPGIFELDSECREDTLIYLKGGSYGDVYRYKTGDETGTSVIIKRDKKNERGKRLLTPGWIREYIHTLDLNHKNIMKFWREPFRYGNHFYGIMQDGGSSLRDIFYNIKEVTPKMFCSIVQQIADGINYIHSFDEKKMKIHGDIRSPNITMNEEDGVCMLIDFGLATERKFDNYCSESKKSEVDKKGNDRWKPPEAKLDRSYKKSRTFDIWSFGIVCLELLAFPKDPDFFKYCSEGLYSRVIQNQTEFQNDVIDYEANNRFKTWKEGDADENLKSEIKEIIKLSCEWDKDKRRENWKDILMKCNNLKSEELTPLSLWEIGNQQPDETVYVPTLHRKVLSWFFLNCPRKRSSNPCYAIDVKSNIPLSLSSYNNIILTTTNMPPTSVPSTSNQLSARSSYKLKCILCKREWHTFCPWHTFCLGILYLLCQPPQQED